MFVCMSIFTVYFSFNFLILCLPTGVLNYVLLHIHVQYVSASVRAFYMFYMQCILYCIYLSIYMSRPFYCSDIFVKLKWSLYQLQQASAGVQ